MIKLPISKIWRQTNRGDSIGSYDSPVPGNNLGTLVSTFNTDLYSNPGKIRATKMISNTTGLNSYPVGFKLFGTGIGQADRIFTVAGNKVYSASGGYVNSTFTADAISGTPTTTHSEYSDIELYNNSSGTKTVCVTTQDDKLYSLPNFGNWNASATISGGNNGPYMMTTYGGRLYISASGIAKIYSTTDLSTIVSPGSQYAIALDTNFCITFLRGASNRIWIGTTAVTGKGYIFEWDGSSSQTTRSYRMESTGALSCVIKDDIPYVMDANGRLLVYSNGTFKEIARLPINDRLLTNARSLTNNRFIHPNGMSLVNGKINVLINNLVADSGSTISEFCPSGIWEYDENIGFTHKYSLSYTPVGTNTITDFGQNRISAAGAISDLKLTNTNSNANGTLLAGATIYTDASTTTSGIYFNDTQSLGNATYNATQRAGYFVTGKMESQKVTDIWQSIFLKYRKLFSSSDSIVVKYRLTEGEPLVFPTEASITWTSTTTFTTTTNVLGLEGYEVEITQGTGGGICSHITKIDVTGGTYTVTVDTVHTGVTTGTAKARFQNWIKLGSISDTTSYWKNFNFPSSATSTWLQIKVFYLLSGWGEIEELDVQNITSQAIK